MTLKDKLKDALELDDLDVITIEADEKLLLVVLVNDVSDEQRQALSEELHRLLDQAGMSRVNHLIFSDVEIKFIKEKA